MGGANSDTLGSRLIVGSGFIGSTLAASSSRRGHRTRVLSRSGRSGTVRDECAPVDWCVGDAADQDLMRHALQDIDEVFWCVGSRLPAESESDLVGAISDRCTPLEQALDVLREMSASPKLYLFSSGGTVYGESTGGPVPESAPTNPITAYGIANVSAELVARRYSNETGNPVTIFRCANVYGPGQQAGRSQGLLAATLSAVRSGEPLVIYGDGQSLRDYVFIDDVVRMVEGIAALESAPDVVNIGTQTGSTVDEVVRLVENCLQLEVVCEYRDVRRSDLRSIVLDTSLVRSLTGVTPVTLEDGIRLTILDAEGRK